MVGGRRPLKCCQVAKYKGIGGSFYPPPPLTFGTLYCVYEFEARILRNCVVCGLWFVLNSHTQCNSQ